LGRAVVLAAVTIGLGAAGCGHVGPGATEPTLARARSTDDARLARDWTVAPHVTLVDQKGETDCGPAALDMMLARWGTARGAPLATAAAPAGGPEGASAGELRDEARRLGFESFVFPGSFGDLDFELGAGRPVLLGLVRQEGDKHAAHFVVVVGHDGARKRWLLADPAHGWQTLRADELARQWKDASWVTLVLYPRTAKAPAAPGARVAEQRPF
jgi:ABC-type bacteriocin/lantibiotic exporter with double-glycine peptidase domain